MKVEFWIMRVVLHQGRRLKLTSEMTPSARLAVMACVSAGKLAVLPDNSIAEPVECFESDSSQDGQADAQTRAREHMVKLQREHPDEDFRLVLNADGL